jgi:hypothetical protein
MLSEDKSAVNEVELRLFHCSQFLYADRIDCPGVEYNPPTRKTYAWSARRHPHNCGFERDEEDCPQKADGCTIHHYETGRAGEIPKWPLLSRSK